MKAHLPVAHFDKVRLDRRFEHISGHRKVLHRVYTAKDFLQGSPTVERGREQPAASRVWQVVQPRSEGLLQTRRERRRNLRHSFAVALGARRASKLDEG